MFYVRKKQPSTTQDDQHSMQLYQNSRGYMNSQENSQQIVKNYDYNRHYSLSL